MRKILFVCSLIVFILSVSAPTREVFGEGAPEVVPIGEVRLLLDPPFERDLYFGLSNSSDVRRLQIFLHSNKFYTGPITGNFFRMTEDAVKLFQKREKITPALGYFGPKTRARVHQVQQGSVYLQTEDNQVVELLVQIQTLRARIKELQAKGSSTTTMVSPPPSPLVPETMSVATSTPEASSLLTPQVVPAPILPSNALVVSNSATSTFPEIEATFFKMGEVNLYNDSAGDIYVSRFETVLYDEMDSVNNRGRKVFLLLRGETTATSTQISKTEFTYITTPPKVGEPHSSTLFFPVGVIISAGETKKISLWIEQMKYVRSGTLKIDSTKVSSTNAPAINGSFSLVLTREAPL